MMRKTKWLVAAALMMSTAGCVETVDSGYAAPSYGYGYGNGYVANGYSSGYYAQPGYSRPVVNNYYTNYTPPPRVVTETRSVPVPQHQADRNDQRWDGDHRSDGRHDEPRHVDRQPSSPPASTHNTSPSATHNTSPSSGSSTSSGSHHDSSRDRDNDHRS